VIAVEGKKEGGGVVDVNDLLLMISLTPHLYSFAHSGTFMAVRKRGRREGRRDVSHE